MTRPDRDAPARPPWRLERGARVLPGGGARFAVWAPRPARVALRLSSEGGAVRDVPMERGADDVWTVEVADARPGDDYLFVLDDERALPDPVSRFQPDGVHGPSRLVDPAAFGWTDGTWTSPELPDMVTLELHVGTFTPAGTFAGVRGQLAALAELGVNAIQLMPVGQTPGARNWGYDVAFPYAVQASYGGPEELRALVDAAHAIGIAVLVDVVYNHYGPEGSTQGAFGPYTTEVYETPWGDAVNLDGPDSDEVRRYFVDNVLHWVVEYHVDGLRFDAIHAFHDRSAVHFLEEVAARVADLERDTGRRVALVAESDLNDPRVVRPRAAGGYGFDAQWNDDFHHAVHAVLTGEEHGYYADFLETDKVATLAKALADRFVYDGTYSGFRRRRHGAPALDVPSDRFVVYVQNHDQVGNRARGRRLTSLVSPRRQRLAAGLLLMNPYVPMLFMGEEYGETRPFQYFTSHGDRELRQDVREGRRREFESFGWPADVPDPQAVETFERSCLDREGAGPDGAVRRALYAALIRLKRSEPALAPGRARFDLLRGAEWVALRLEPWVGPGDALLAVFHLGATEEQAQLPGWRGPWRPVLCTEEPRFGGDRPLGTLTARGGSAVVPAVPLPPESAVLWRRSAT